MSTSNRTGGNKDRQTACGDIEKKRHVLIGKPSR
jgi:hypothetical protein